MVSFEDYTRFGWALTPIRAGEKRPRGEGWNTRAKAITDPARAAYLENAGLLHAFSGTCALDIDHIDLARAWLEKRGIDLDAMLQAPDAVRIHSGDPTRGKLIYRLPQPLPTKQIKSDDKTLMLFELRCGTLGGNSAQDVLPPSTNPRTGKQYEWLGDWRKLPMIPPELHQLWLELITPAVETNSPRGAEYDTLRELLEQLDPDMAYDEWLRVGMALHHETRGAPEGLALWDEWSARSSKYKGTEDLVPHWRSFRLDAPGAVTLGSLLASQVADPNDFEEVTEEDIDLLAKVDRQLHEERVQSIKFTPLYEIANRPPPTWLIDDFLPREDLNMLVGASGAGKSFLALDMALAVARGVKWADRDVEPGTVCWLAAEAEGSLRNRYRAYAAHREIALDSVQNFYVLGSGISLSDRACVAALADAAAALNPVLVVVDTLAAASGGVNENSGEDMAVVLDHCRLLHQATGATILLIHHTGKDQEKGARGWSGLKAAMHAELWVEKVEDSNLRRVTITKMRDGLENIQLYFRLAPVTVGIDHKDRPIQAAVIEFADPEADAPPVVREAANLPKSPEQAAALQAIREAMPLSGLPMSCDEVYKVLIPLMPEPVQGERDRRPQRAMKVLNDLRLGKWLHIHNGLVYSPEAASGAMLGDAPWEDLL